MGGHLSPGNTIVTLCMLDTFATIISFVNIKTVLGTSPDNYRRLVASDLGSNCLQGLLAAIFCVTFGTN